MVVKEFKRLFDLNKAPLIRVGFIREVVEKYILFVDMRHIITDGVSMDIFIREFMAMNNCKELPSLRLQYKDYAEWLTSDTQKNDVKKQEKYWVKEFQGEIPILNFPTDYSRPPVRSFEGDKVTFKVDNELTRKIKKIVTELELTPYTFFLAVYYILLSKYSKQEEIIVGTGVTGRTHADLQNIVNMLPMKNRSQRNKTFREFLLEVKIIALNAFENQDYQFEELTNRLGIKVDLKRNPLFETVFQFQNTIAKRTEDVHVDGEEDDQAKAFQDRYEYNAARYELMIEAFEFEHSIRMVLTYSTALFKRATMEKFAERYLEFLKQVTEDDTVKLKDIALSHDLLTAAKDTTGFDFGFESITVPEAGSLKEGEEKDGLK